MSESYILPSNPSVISNDPLGLCDNENPTAWSTFVASVRLFRTKPPAESNIQQLPNLIKDISYTLKMDGDTNTEFLSSFLREKFTHPDDPLAATTLDAILDAALALPALFPSNSLRYLSEAHKECQLSSAQLASLLAHQLLNTLSRPPNNSWGCTFTCWYSDPQGLTDVVRGYLSTIFDFFILPNRAHFHITYRYYSQPSLSLEQDIANWRHCFDAHPFQNIVIEPVSTKTVPFPHPCIPCTLVASNKSPGFGPACTQEELVTAACPPLLPLGALFIAPPVPDNAVLVADGSVPLMQWKGQGREACRQDGWTMARHTFLLLDAAELDESTTDVLPDLETSCFLRDLEKAYTGFSALKGMGITHISSPLWGAGSFGGDPLVKTLVLAMAAARAGMDVHISVDEKRLFGTEPDAPNLLSVIQDMKERCGRMSVGEMYDIIQSDKARKCRSSEDLLLLLKVEL